MSWIKREPKASLTISEMQRNASLLHPAAYCAANGNVSSYFMKFADDV